MFLTLVFHAILWDPIYQQAQENDVIHDHLKTFEIPEWFPT